MEELLAHTKNIREIADQPVKFNNVMRFALDVSLIVLAIAASTTLQNTWAYALSVFLIGSRMRGLMNLLHECSHNGLVIGSKRLNNLLGQICALPLLMTREAYTQSHMRHHLHFGERHKDPDLIRYLAAFGDVAVRGARSLDEWIGAVLNIRNFIVYAYIKPTRDLFTSGWSNLLAIVAFWGSVVSLFEYLDRMDLLFLYWVVPFFTSFKLVCYIAELAEHFGIYGKLGELDRTRNMYVNKVAELLLWPHGDNYHLVHHLFPFVPGFHLARTDDYLKHHCRNYAEHRSDQSMGLSAAK